MKQECRRPLLDALQRNVRRESEGGSRDALDEASPNQRIRTRPREYIGRFDQGQLSLLLRREDGVSFKGH
jgi:hypothetical protein